MKFVYENLCEKSYTFQPIENGPIIEVSVQKATGSFHMNWLHTPLTSFFTNLTNIIVRVRPRDYKDSPVIQTPEAMKTNVPPGLFHQNYSHYLEFIATYQKDNQVESDVCKGYEEKHEQFLKEGRKTILISAHFDTATGSPGASDDTVPVAVMLELINVYAHRKPLDIPLLFVFNGGEEPGMQAAFGFIAQHPWAKMFVSLPLIQFQIGLEQQLIWSPVEQQSRESCYSKLHQEIFGLLMLMQRAVDLVLRVLLQRIYLQN